MNRAGWYPDPSNQGTQRYFDGTTWTDNLAPLTGDGLSTKSSAVAGLLQIFLGWFGLGRFYLGYTAIGIVQLLLFLISMPLLFIGVGFFTWLGLGLWVFIEGIMMLAGAITDSEGRKLR